MFWICKTLFVGSKETNKNKVEFDSFFPCPSISSLCSAALPFFFFLLLLRYLRSVIWTMRWWLCGKTKVVSYFFLFSFSLTRPCLDAVVGYAEKKIKPREPRRRLSISYESDCIFFPSTLYSTLSSPACLPDCFCCWQTKYFSRYFNLSRILWSIIAFSKEEKLCREREWYIPTAHKVRRKKGEGLQMRRGRGKAFIDSWIYTQRINHNVLAKSSTPSISKWKRKRSEEKEYIYLLSLIRSWAIWNWLSRNNWFFNTRLNLYRISLFLCVYVRRRCNDNTTHKRVDQCYWWTRRLAVCGDYWDNLFI